MIGEVKPPEPLLPCPFCGTAAVLENYVIEAAAFCPECRATIIRRHTAKHDVGIAMATRAWNTRPTDSSSEGRGS